MYDLNWYLEWFVESWADECQYIFMNESIWISAKAIIEQFWNT